MKEFEQILSCYQKEINKEIERFFEEKIKQTRQPFLRETLKLLKEFSLRPGKRIRPILVNQGYFLAGGKNREAILKASIFIELIHNYLLIHDDIIDRDKIRRGGKTLHYHYGGGHYGTSQAIIAGDMMAALGYEILASSNFPTHYKIGAVQILNQTNYLTCYGQMLETQLRLRSKFGKEIKENDILEIHRNKTAYYTFAAPLQIGALLAGASQRFLKKIEEFALPLGIAFQIQDDIEDDDIGKNYLEVAEKLTVLAKEALSLEKAFPEKERKFLLDLADYIKRKH